MWRFWFRSTKVTLERQTLKTDEHNVCVCVLDWTGNASEYNKGLEAYEEFQAISKQICAL